MLLWWCLWCTVALAERESSNVGISHEELLKRNDGSRTAVLVTGDECSEDEFDVSFIPTGSLGLQFDERFRIIDFPRDTQSVLGVAEQSGLLKIDDELVAVNGDVISDLLPSDGFQVIEEANVAARYGEPRVFRFRRRSLYASPVRFSDEQSAKNTGDLTHIDVFGVQGEEDSFRGLLGDGLGVQDPRDCSRRKLVFVEPSTGCSARLQTDAKRLQDAYAVVYRGDCSFHDKGFVLSRLYNVSGVIVINSEDSIFRMQLGNVANNEVEVPMIMISSTSGDRLREMGGDHEVVRSRLEGRIVGSEKCLELEHDHPEEKSVLEVVEDSVTIPNKLFGSFAPSGYIRLVGDETNRSYDFLTAMYSGRIPVGSIVPLSLGTRSDLMVCTLIGQSSDDEMFASIARIQKASNAKGCVIIVSRNTKIYRIQGPLPSEFQIPVMMVTASAGSVLSAGGFQVSFEPTHSVAHRWDEMSRLENKNAWPSDAKLAKRMAVRLKKSVSSSSCLRSHLDMLLEL
uniref:PA domain-containing protein n=1 Tax=Mucochytrium quahogii TaxID=96639 RepID=A0A7S2W710_9STRA|mmetsp:Transcript_15177/g.32482  ORF Transcript_15177/g.32482 Transcript_15177/m.32482 type:complete len:512 (+) Transcript_15177:114-1649(+)